jgi:hypothetical protein
MEIGSRSRRSEDGGGIGPVEKDVEGDTEK